MLLKKVGMVISCSGVSVTVSSQSEHRLSAISEEISQLLVTTSTEKLLTLERARNIRNMLHAYQQAKRCSVKRVMAEAVK